MYLRSWDPLLDIRQHSPPHMHTHLSTGRYKYWKEGHKGTEGCETKFLTQRVNNKIIPQGEVIRSGPV